MAEDRTTNAQERSRGATGRAGARSARRRGGRQERPATRWPPIPLCSAGILLLALVAPAPAQEDGLEDFGTDAPPVIVDERPLPDNGAPLTPAGDVFVAIHGAWASDPAACAGVDAEDGGGFYVTDTLIRWEEETCSIRQVEVLPTVDDAAKGAVMRASCATEAGRSPRVFELEERDEDTLALNVLLEEGERTFELKRCPRGR